MAILKLKTKEDDVKTLQDFNDKQIKFDKTIKYWIKKGAYAIPQFEIRYAEKKLKLSNDEINEVLEANNVKADTDKRSLNGYYNYLLGVNNSPQTPIVDLDIPDVEINCTEAYVENTELYTTLQHFKNDLSYRFNKKLNRWMQYIKD